MNIERKIRRNAARKQKQIFANVDTFWLNDEDFKPCNCSLCGAEIKDVHDSANPYPFGNWTFAVLENEKQVPERCCRNCDTREVIPARIKMTSTPHGLGKFVRAQDRANRMLDDILRWNSRKKAA